VLLTYVFPPAVPNLTLLVVPTAPTLVVEVVYPPPTTPVLTPPSTILADVLRFCPVV
jgi:hypothetical protein